MEEPSIKVGVLFRLDVRFELKGQFRLLENDRVYSGKFFAKASGNSVDLSAHGKNVCSLPTLTFAPLERNEARFVLFKVTIGLRFHWEREQAQCFRGSLQLIADDNAVVAINLILLEDYLISVISSEMNAAGSLEFLKAHAVVSRSWLLAQITGEQKSQDSCRVKKRANGEIFRWYDREQHRFYDVCADDHCQRYQGMGKVSRQAERAVEETCGVALCSRGKICDARFSKCCGGISESFENVWQPLKRSYLQKIVDNDKKPSGYDLNLKQEKAAKKWIESFPPAFCNTGGILQILNDYDRETAHFYRWKIDYCQEELAGLLTSNTGIEFGNILDLQPVERGDSGRLVRLKIVGSKISLIIGKELEIRKTLSPSHLYSSAFTVEKSNISGGVPQKFALVGAGWGHGVGLCQIGAAVMGEKGYSFNAILTHYFKGAHLETKYRYRG